jgi:tRNA 5-methylaminomethyl-2-thiouridine biosynthesis bifunctional protein
METPLLLSATGLLQNWTGQERFVVLQTEFGNGLPFLQLWSAWRSAPQAPTRLHFFAFSQKPIAQDTLASILSKDQHELAAQLHSQWPLPVAGLHRLEFEQGRVILTLGFGSLQNLAPQLQADALLVSPENTGSTSDFPLRALARFASPAATLIAFSLSPTQRADLLDAGFETAPCTQTGFWTGRILRRSRVHPPVFQRSATVIGAGLAGTAIAYRLAQRGWNITLIERHSAPAQEASGNKAAVLSPMVAKDESRTARLSRACFLHLLREIRQLSETGFPVEWSPCGVLQLAKSPDEEPVLRSIADRFPDNYLQFLSSNAIQDRIGLDVPGLLFPTGGWVNPASLCCARLNAAGSRVQRCFHQEALQIQKTADGWIVRGNQSIPLAQTHILILANAHDALQFPALQGLRFKTVRGQVTHLPENLLPPIPHVVCRDGYLTPAHHGISCLGATYDFNTHSRTLDSTGHQTNLARLPQLIGLSLPNEISETVSGRVGFRTLTPDRLPLSGALPDLSQPPTDELRKTPRLPGLYGLLGLGSRGLVWSSLMAELLASQITGDPLPLERDLVEATDPARFQVRAGRVKTTRL